LEEQVLFPEVDLRQRLTLKAGYGVAEFQLAKESALVGKTLVECGLRELEVRVLSVTRGGAVMPNPGKDFVLMRGDYLLCYGKLLTLKSLIPSKRRRPRRTSSTAVLAQPVASEEPATADHWDNGELRDF
jgi:ribosomal protein S6--L-glutamate ligase